MILRWKMPFTFARALWHAFVYWRAGKPAIAPREVIDYRWSKCTPCPHRVLEQCEICACFIGNKVTLSSEACPDEPARWRRLT